MIQRIDKQVDAFVNSNTCHLDSDIISAIKYHIFQLPTYCDSSLSVFVNSLKYCVPHYPTKVTTMDWLPSLLITNWKLLVVFGIALAIAVRWSFEFRQGKRPKVQ